MKPEKNGVIAIGGGVATLLEMGGLRMRLDELFDVDKVAGLRRQYPPGYFAAARRVPQIGLHVALNGCSLLIDPSRDTLPPDHHWVLPEEEHQPPLRDQLAAAGIDPLTITDVIITHLHFDHFSGVTTPEGALLCPNARHHIPLLDWEGKAFQAALRQADSFVSQTLGQVPAAQRHFMVQDHDLIPGISLFHAPGESDGHFVVRIAGEEQIIYYVGDLIHHPLELIHTQLGGAWAKPKVLRHTRSRLIARATEERALVIASHVGLLTVSSG